MALVCAAMMMPMNAKTLVAYFSATGTTKAAAEKLAKQHNAVLWEIEPAEKYTAADLDWRNPNSRSSVEMNDPEERPTIKQCTNVTPYDTVYVGFPICYSEVEMDDMLFTKDCRGFPYRLVCWKCYKTLMQKGFDGVYYDEMNERN